MTKYTHLSINERESIFLMLQEWKKPSEIARSLWRDKGTLSRELERNPVLIQWKWAKKEKTKSDYHYLPDSAQKKYTERRKKCIPCSPFEDERIRFYVISGLTEKWWSPDIISGMMRKEYTEDLSFRVSHETIYEFIYSKEGEKLNLKSYLLRSHRKRKTKTGRSVRGVSKTRIPGRVDIDERPKSVEDREEFWNYEGDSVLSGIRAWAALHTEVERKSRFLMVKKIPQKTALLTLEAQKKIFSALPKLARRTTTLDNGTENVEHVELTRCTWILVYYAKPYHSWERGSNENANGMIRRFFPKGTDFSTVSDEEIQRVVDIINNRPRKILWYKSSKEVFEYELNLLSMKN